MYQEQEPVMCNDVFILNMFGILGRISVAVYFYMHCVQNFAFITIFMMMQMIVGTLIMPFTPKIIEKFGKKNTAILSMVIQGSALIILFFGPYETSYLTLLYLYITDLDILQDHVDQV